MQHSQEAQVADITADALPLAGVTRSAPADPESAALQPLVLRTCQALQAMAGSLEALESVLSRMEALEPGTDHHAELLQGTEETVAHVVALLRREGPPLLFRAQALRLRLRLHGYAAGNSAAIALRTLHADLDGLAGFRHEPPARMAAHWAPFLRRARANTMIMLSEFDRHARQIASQLAGGSPVPEAAIPVELPLPR